MRPEQYSVVNLEVNYVHRSDRNSRNWLHFKHSHPFAEIFYITGGKGSFLIGDVEINVAEKDIVLIAPYEEHTEFSDYNTPLEYFVIGVGGFSISEKSLYNIPYLLIHDKKREYAYYFYKTYEEATINLTNSDKIIQNLVSTLLLIFEQEKNLTIEQNDISAQNHAMIMIKHFLDVKFKEEINLETLAEEFHMSKYYLSHKFKDEYGVSPIKYLNNVRIETIKELLSSSNYSITEIATMMGYTSQSYLAQVFKKDTGLTPAQYRKKERQKSMHS